MTAAERVLPREELARRLTAERAGRTVVFTNGCFDILHVGHIRALEAARALGDILVVGVNSDDSVRRLKGDARPIVPEAERAEMLAALKPVDFTVIFHEDTPVETIAALKPDVHVKSGDYNADSLPETPIVRSYGGRVEIVPFVHGFSTTDLIGTILQRAAR
ncbi:MAG TPA: D-glycero-beta-D-manno-heptose 1-phosphate adenylyltransferase [Armatimonadota bacterium]